MALTRKIVLDATPGEVWDKVATGPGLSSWFVPHEIEPRKGGVCRADFGGGTVVEGRVLVYEPGRRVIYGGEAIPDDVGADPKKVDEQPTMEFWVGRDGGDHEDFPRGDFRGIGDVRGRRLRPGRAKTVLHFRQRGFPVEGQDVYEDGWDLYFFNLIQYFKHFRGRTALTHTALVAPTMERQQSFEVLTKALGIDPDVNEEDTVTARAANQQFEGTVDLRVSTEHIEVVGLRDKEGLLRAMSDETCGGALFRYDYVVDPPPDFAAVRERGNDLQGWLQQQFA